MKKLVAVAVVAVSLLAASLAMGSFLLIHRAHRGSVHDARYRCNHVLHCRYDGVVRCHRVSGRRVDCLNTLEYAHSHSAPRYTCTYWLDWRLTQLGVLNSTASTAGGAGATDPPSTTSGST